MNNATLLPILVQAGMFIAAFAGLAAAAVMLSITKKLGLGVLAVSFRSTSWGVIFIAGALVIEAVAFYLGLQNDEVVSLLKTVLLIVGTYVIVIGAKSTADKLESATK